MPWEEGESDMERSRSSHWLVAVASLVILLPALTACSPTTSGDLGQLTGVVYTGGGMNAETRPAEAKLTITSTSGEPSRTYTAETDSDGSFSLELLPGTYELTGRLVTGIPGGYTNPQEVTVVAGRTTTVEVFSYHP